MTLIVRDPGLLTTVQDLGRPGLGHLGVSPSGAFDRLALRQANWQVANPEDAAGLEVLRGRIELEATTDHLVAISGAASSLQVNGVAVGHRDSVFLRAGARLTLGQAPYGLRTYLAVAGGITIEPILGSRSTDTLAGIGAPLQAGDVLPVGLPQSTAAAIDIPWAPELGETRVEVELGPRDDWFTPAAVRRLLDEPWQVTDSCNRVGLRLSGRSLARAVDDELPSEPCLRGAIQVSSDGQPTVFGPDHPVTGGYPVIAVVRDDNFDRLAQVGPGDYIRFSRSGALNIRHP